MPGDDEDAKFDVYKYRRRAERSKLSINTLNSEIPKILNQNIIYEMDDNNKSKRYAILQEPRTEFSFNKFRTLLLIYSDQSWKIFVLTTLFIEYVLDTCIYSFCTYEERSLWLILMIICLNSIYTFDVLIVCGLKFSRNWRKTLNLVEPSTNKVIVEIILAIPYGLLYLIRADTAVFDFTLIAPIMATLRAYRILEYFYNKSSEAGSNQWSTFLLQYLILLLLCVHSWTCVWFLFSYRNFDIHKIRLSWSSSAVYLPIEDTFDWYFVCTYWSIMCLTTNAIGDLYPVTTSERIAAIGAILVGFALTTIVYVGSLTSQFITITTRRAKYVRQLKKIKNYLGLIKMDADITKRIMSYYEDLWYQKSGVFKPECLELLPLPLQMEICYDLNAVPLYSSLIFRKLPEAFLRRLSLAMNHQFYLPGDIVYNHNHNKTIMVCITNGVLELLSDEDDESPMISFCKGTCFGEISLVYNIPARCTVKAATYVECQVLHKAEFIKLMITYPDLVDSIRLQLRERIERCRLRKKKAIKISPLTLNIYVSKDRPKSSIKCLKDKLRYIQGKTDIDTIKDNELDQNCLDLYIMSEHVKKKTTVFTCVSDNIPWILEYDCYLVKYWEHLMLLIVFYICIVYPFYIGIKRRFPDDGFFFQSHIVVTVILIFNVLLSCVTAIKTKKKYIKTIKKILNHRMKLLGFYLDVVAIIPFEYIVTIHTHSEVKYHDNYRDHLYYLCKGSKLCLVWRISNFFEKLEQKLLLNTLLIKVAKYFVYIGLLCYWCGVILYMESCFVSRCSESSWYSQVVMWQDENSRDNKTRYPLIPSVYFATTILLSVGYGDYAPFDKYDMGFVAFISLYGVLLIGFSISEFSALVTHWSRTKTAFLEVIITIDKFLRENNMHPAIKARIMSFYDLQWQYNSGVELTEDNWLEATVIPQELRKKVLHQARFRALTSIRFFQVKNKEYIQTLTETATDIILPPGEIVYYGGTVSRELYIIEKGYCLLTSHEMNEKKIERVIGPGNHLGLLVLLYGVPAIGTVITLTHCKLISISHAAYTSALSLFPAMKEHDNLLTEEELRMIETQAKAQRADEYLTRYDKLSDKKVVRIKNLFKRVIDVGWMLVTLSRKSTEWTQILFGTLHRVILHSFINVYSYYTVRKENYFKSFDQFHILSNIARYLLMPIAIKPDGIFLKCWALLRVGVAIVLAYLIPVAISLAPQCGQFNVTLLALEIICYLDLYLMLHVAYYGPKNQLIYHPYLTAKNYLKGPFIVDLLTCLPWYAIWMIFVSKHNEDHTVADHVTNPHVYHCILRMINVLQIYKVYAVFWADSLSALRRAYLMSVVQFLIVTLFFLNLYTSILIILSCRYVIAPDELEFKKKLSTLSLAGPYMNATFHPGGNMICALGSWIDQSKILKDDHMLPSKVYLLAYYWSATSFSGAGFGDITAQDTAHMILAICINIHGVLFFGYVYARIASLKAMADQVLTTYQENIKHLDMFLNRESVSFALKKTVIEYWKYQWKRTGGWSHQTIFGKLHANLNEDAVLYMYEKTLREIPLFDGVEYSFFRAFAKKLRERYFQKGYLVLRANEVLNSMYIIYRGKVDIVSDDNEVEACMGPGGIFGNIKGASKYLTQSNVIASRNIDLLVIQGNEFYSLLKSYPSVLRKVKNCVENAPKDYVLPSVISGPEHTSLEAESTYPISYESGDDDEDYEYANIDLNDESPQRSTAEISSHGSRSILSTANADYIPASLLLFKPHRWLRSSVIPDCALVSFMDLLTMVLSYIDFMCLIYQMAFQSIPYFFHFCMVFDVIFLYKTFLDVHTGYVNRYGEYVLKPEKVRKMYFSKTFLRRRDLLANLPISYLSFALGLRYETMLGLFTYLRTPQLFRITYLFTFRTHRKINIGSANLIFKLAYIGIMASILAHVNACLFFKLSCLTPIHCTSTNWMSKQELNLRPKYKSKSYFSIYIAALWYIINLLTITGTGDVSSQNNFEVIETIIIVIIIKFCTGLLISEMSGMITAHSSSRIAYDYVINALRDGLRDMDLSLHQMNKMWDYVRELWNRHQGRQMPELICSLPFRLQCQVMQAVYGCHIKDSIIFSKTDDDFKRMLCMWIRHCVFFPGNYIVQCGDSDQCIYFIHRGEVEVLTVHQNLTESVYDILGPEDSFGIAQGLFVGVCHHFSFRARTVVDIVYLKLEQWKYLLDFYPKAAKVVQKKVENVYLAI